MADVLMPAVAVHESPPLKRQGGGDSGDVENSAPAAAPDGAEPPPRKPDSPPPVPKEPLTPELEKLARCSKILNVLALLSSWQWMSYQPTLPLLLSERLELDVTYVSYTYAVFIGAALLGMLFMNQLTLRFSIRALVAGMLWFRIFSGLMHWVAVIFINPFSVPLIMVSRFLHGLTAIQVPLSIAWVGARLPSEMKPDAIAERNLWGGIGMFLGPITGSGLAAILSDSGYAYSAPGIFTLLSSVAMLTLNASWFTDDELLPKPPASKTKARKEDRKTGLGMGPCVSLGLHLGLIAIGHAGIDSLLSLCLLSMYGWPAQTMVWVWAPVVGAYSIGTIIAGKLVRTQGLLVTLGVQYALLLGGMATFPWQPSQMGGAVPPVQLVLGLSAWMTGASIAVTLHMTILTMRLAPWQNASIQPRIHIGLTMGRMSGPLLTAWVYDWGNTVEATLGANLTFAVSVLLSIVSAFATLGFWRTLYFQEDAPGAEGRRSMARKLRNSVGSITEFVNRISPQAIRASQYVAPSNAVTGTHVHRAPQLA